MKLLIFSDIHGDLAALARLMDTEADYYVAAGDLVNFGRGLDRCGEILARRAGFPKERGARQADLGRNRRNRGGGGSHEDRCRNYERGHRRQQGADKHLLNRLHGYFPLCTGKHRGCKDFLAGLRCGPRSLYPIQLYAAKGAFGGVNAR